MDKCSQPVEWSQSLVPYQSVLPTCSTAKEAKEVDQSIIIYIYIYIYRERERERGREVERESNHGEKNYIYIYMSCHKVIAVITMRVNCFHEEECIEKRLLKWLRNICRNKFDLNLNNFK